ncbi:MAG TPA: hypothetical protein ENH19_01965 [Actinobacteria bacterium]|nr:hypothetical protein [Actinomycetes bacterium]HEX21402.1 hypothetical protein [Actinomycetota bacterium]
MNELKEKIEKAKIIIKESGARNSKKDIKLLEQIIEMANKLFSKDENPTDKAIKEAGESLDNAIKIMEAKTDGSIDALISRVRAAVDKKYGNEINRPWLFSTFTDYVIVKGMNEKYTKINYKDDGETVTLGDSTPVKYKQTFEAIKEAIWFDKQINHQIRLDSKNLVLLEADNKKGYDAEIVLIEAGPGNKNYNAYYPAETLARDYKIFEGSKMYIDHLSAAEERKLGGLPRSIKDWVSTVKETWYDPTTSQIKGGVKFTQDWFKDLVKEAKDEIGVSIHAIARGKPGRINGELKKIVEAFTQVSSVDWVTEAGAGGKVIKILEAHFNEDESDSTTRKDDGVMETQLKEANDKIEGLTKRIEEVSHQFDANSTKTKVGEILEANALPAAAKLRVAQSFAGKVIGEGKDYESETTLKEAVDTAVKQEREYISQFSKARIVGMGEGSTMTTKESASQELDELFGLKESKEEK